jgi:HEAT repeat protein
MAICGGALVIAFLSSGAAGDPPGGGEPTPPRTGSDLGPKRGRSPPHAIAAGPVAAPVPAAATLEDELERVAALRRSGTDEDLEAMATHAADARVRIAALRALVGRSGAEAAAFLLRRARDDTEREKVRAAAALTGVIDSSLPARVRAGAVCGLADAGTAECASILYRLAASEDHPDRLVARDALGLVSDADSAFALLRLFTEGGNASRGSLPPAARRALCRSLGTARLVDAVGPLRSLLRSDPDPGVRAAAASALGRLGRTDARTALEAAAEDPSPAVRRAARLASCRLAPPR